MEPTQAYVDARGHIELWRSGLLALRKRMGSEQTVFLAVNSLQRPAEHNTDDASANARLAERFPYVFEMSRFAQYQQSTTCNQIGALQEAADVEQRMNNWLRQYVLADPDGASEIERAARPLWHARVKVCELRGQPGLRIGRLEIEPHYLLEPAMLSACFPVHSACG